MNPAPLVHKTGYSSDLQVDPGRHWPGQTPRPDLNPCCLPLIDQRESDLEILAIAFVQYLMSDRATSKIEVMTRHRATSKIVAMARRHGDAECGPKIVIRSCCYLVHFF